MIAPPVSRVQPQWEPLIVAVAPNGARRSKDDHPTLPITPKELADCAVRCREAGASLFHLHVRDKAGRHTLDADAYGDATRAVRAAVGDDMIIQMTSEAVGIYTPEEQMTAVRAVRPEAVSMAVRELIPDAAHEKAAADFLSWLIREGIHPQYILYEPEEVARFADLRARGIIPGDNVFVLYVLGRYHVGETTEPIDLLPFLKVTGALHCHWAICAFGQREGACALTAAALGGHARVGFENNRYLNDARLASDNAALVAQVRAGADLVGRPLADADTARSVLAA